MGLGSNLRVQSERVYWSLHKLGWAATPDGSAAVRTARITVPEHGPMGSSLLGGRTPPPPPEPPPREVRAMRLVRPPYTTHEPWPQTASDKLPGGGGRRPDGAGAARP